MTGHDDTPHDIIAKASEALEMKVQNLGWEWHADSGRWRRDGGKDEPWWVYAATLEDAVCLGGSDLWPSAGRAFLAEEKRNA